MIIQRNFLSILFYLFYNIFILIFTLEILILSRHKIVELKDRLKIFVGLTLATISFQWSIRQTPNILTYHEIFLIFILGSWLLLEIRDEMYQKSG